MQGLPKQDTAQAVAALCERAGLPNSLKDRYVALGVVPPDTPLPMNMLTRLWGLEQESDAEATANLFETKVGCCFFRAIFLAQLPQRNRFGRPYKLALYYFN